MAKSTAVESPANEARRRTRNPHRLAARLRYWATCIENGNGAAVVGALRAWADCIDPKKGKA